MIAIIESKKRFIIIRYALYVITDKSGLPEYNRKNIFWCNNCSEIEGRERNY